MQVAQVHRRGKPAVGHGRAGLEDRGQGQFPVGGFAGGGQLRRLAPQFAQQGEEFILPDGLGFQSQRSRHARQFNKSAPLVNPKPQGLTLLDWPSYHTSGQLKDEDYTSGPLNSLGVHRTFDSLSRLSGVSPAGGSPLAVFSYDSASRLDTVTADSNTATYVYEPDSPLMQSVTFKQGGTTRLATTKLYDHLNRLAAIANAPSAAPVSSVVYSYNSANQRTQAVREDNRYWGYGYDALGQVTSAVKKQADGTPSLGASYAYAYDDIGNRKTATANAHLSTFSSNSLNQYSTRTVPGFVDVLGTAVTDANVTVNGQPAQRLGEDWYLGVAAPNTAIPIWAGVTVAGVRTGAAPGGGDAVANGTRHTWVPKTPEAYSYDADGNLTGDGRWLYTWDGENRLIAMETRPDILAPIATFPLTERRKLEFNYDAQGRRIAKNVYVWNGTAWLLGSSTRFLYDGWNLLADLNALNSNAVVCTYVWGLDLSGSFQGAGGVGGLLFASSTTLGATLHAPCYDGNGNVISYVDMATGIKSATYDYSAFGEAIIADGVAKDALTFRFSTKYTDNETNLLYYGLRYYSPSMGRWLGRDPLEEQGGENLYIFVGNNGIAFIDSLGREIWNYDGARPKDVDYISRSNTGPEVLGVTWISKRPKISCDAEGKNIVVDFGVNVEVLTEGAILLRMPDSRPSKVKKAATSDESEHVADFELWMTDVAHPLIQLYENKCKCSCSQKGLQGLQDILRFSLADVEDETRYFWDGKMGGLAGGVSINPKSPHHISGSGGSKEPSRSEKNKHFDKIRNLVHQYAAKIQCGEN